VVSDVYLGGGEGTDPDSLVISNSSVGSGWYRAVLLGFNHR